MIAILDPALLEPRHACEARPDLREVLKACRSGNLRLVPFEEYWALMWQEFGPLLESEAQDRFVSASLRELQKLAKRHATDGIAPLTAGKVWRKGFRQLFNSKWLQSNKDWEKIMARVVVRAVATGEEVVVLTRRIRGRNVAVHQTGSSVIWENTRWLLYVQPPGIGARHIPCVYNARNLENHWTTRFDIRLPAAADGARYPFCPPDKWWKPGTAAVSTVQGKPCFVDARQSGWARPNISNGAGYHWDVFIRDNSIVNACGLNQLNVVAFGGPDAEGRPGDIHHVPAAKRHVFRDIGWSCP